MIPIILGALMFLAAYLTYTKKFNLFSTYYDPKKDDSYIKEMQELRRKKSTKLFLIMGGVAITSGVFKLLGLVFFEYLFIAIYLFFVIYLLGGTFGAEGTKTVYILVAALASFMYFSTSFRILFETNEVSFDTAGVLTITGSNKVEIKVDDINEVVLLNDLPKRDHKVGSVKEFNGTYRGTYVLENGSTAQLYLNGALETCIKIATDDHTYYVALVSDEETKQVYGEIDTFVKGAAQ